jgi:hypothetical protein
VKIDLTGPRRGKSVVMIMAAMLEDYGKSGTPLSIRMRELAATGHVRALELYSRAQELDDAMTAWGSNTVPPADGEILSPAGKRMVGTWARARRLWSDITGEDLI